MQVDFMVGFDGPNTVALANYKGSGLANAAGIAKRHPDDANNVLLGEQLAVGRALIALGSSLLAQAGYPAPKTVAAREFATVKEERDTFERLLKDVERRAAALADENSRLKQTIPMPFKLSGRPW